MRADEHMAAARPQAGRVERSLDAETVPERPIDLVLDRPRASLRCGLLAPHLSRRHSAQRGTAYSSRAK